MLNENHVLYVFKLSIFYHPPGMFKDFIDSSFLKDAQPGLFSQSVAAVVAVRAIFFTKQMCLCVGHFSMEITLDPYAHLITYAGTVLLPFYELGITLSVDTLS